MQRRPSSPRRVVFAVLFAALLAVSPVGATAGPFPAPAATEPPTQPTQPATPDVAHPQPAATERAATPAAPFARGDWPTDGHDPGRSGHNPNSSGPKTPPNARWVHESTNDVSDAPVAVANGTVYVGGDNSLRAVDNETGELRWNVTGVYVESITVADGVVVTATPWNEEVRAFDAATGTERWNRTEVDANSVVVLDGTVYTHDSLFNNQRLYALDLETGTEQWHAEFDAETITGGLAAAGDTVYATGKLSARDHAVFALDAADGRTRWTFEVEGDVVMDPVVVDGSVYVGGGSPTYDPKFYRLNATDGHVEWIADLGTRPDGAAVADGSVHVAAGNTIQTFDVATGTEQWRHRLAASLDYGLVYTEVDAIAPAVADGAVYAINDRGHLVALDGATGTELWTYRLQGRGTRPAVADDRVYVHAYETNNYGDDYTRVYALEPRPFAFSGYAVSDTTVAPGDAVTASVTVTNVDDEPRVYNLSLRANSPLPLDPRALDWANGTLAPGASRPLAFTGHLNTSGDWNLSVQRLLEPEPSVGPVTVTASHAPAVDAWPTRDGDAGRTKANLDTSAPKQHVQEVWNLTSFDDSVRPVIANGSVFVVHRLNRPYPASTVTTLTAYDETTGAFEWAFNVSAHDRRPAGSPTYHDGTVYLFTQPSNFDGGPAVYDNSLFAVHAGNGSLAWRQDFTLNFSSRSNPTDHAPVVANGRVIVTGGTPEGSYDANASAIAFDADTGVQQWRYRDADPDARENAKWAAAAGDRVVVALSDEVDHDDNNVMEDNDRVVGIDAATGTAVWSRGDGTVDVREQPVIRDGRVYAVIQTTQPDGDAIEELHVYDAADGTPRWTFRPPDVEPSDGGWAVFSPVVTPDAVYVHQMTAGSGLTDNTNRLYRLDPATGTVVWNRTVPDLLTIFAVDGLLYAGDYRGQDTHVYDAATGEYYTSTDLLSRGHGTVQALANGTMITYADSTTANDFRVIREGGRIEYTDLTVDTHRVGVRENVTVTATATNLGAYARGYDVDLRVSPDDGNAHHWIWNYPNREGWLAPGERTTITWTVQLRERGDVVFTLLPRKTGQYMNRHAVDRAGSETVRVADARDGSTIPLGGPRSVDATAGAWPTHGFDAANTGNRSEAGPTAVLADPVAWSVNRTGDESLDSAPTVGDGTVFVGGMDASDDESVLAFDAATGSLRWSYPTHSTSELESAPTYADGFVYATDRSDRLYALNASTGERLWTFTGGGRVAGTTVVDDTVYVTVAASHYADGETTYERTLYALNATDRAVRWTLDFAAEDGEMPVTPAVADGTVYVAVANGSAYALDAATGTVQWSTRLTADTSSVFVTSPVVGDGVVYVGAGTELHALDAATGARSWHAGADFDGSDGVSPALANGRLYFGGDDKVSAMDAATGDYVWNYTICSRVDPSPAVADGVVYVGTDGGDVFALDGATGGLTWRYAAGTDVPFQSAVAGGRLYVASLNDSSDVSTLAALAGGDTAVDPVLFDYSNLQVAPTTASTGQQVTVNATVENLVDSPCTYTADLRVDGTVVDTTSNELSDYYRSDSETVEFTWTPAATGTYAVSIADLPAVSVTVTGPQPEVTVLPEAYDFGDQNVSAPGDQWKSTYVRVRNDGQATLNWTGASIGGADNDSFTLLTGGDGMVLAPGDTGYAHVYFVPQSAGPKTAALTITTNDTDEPVTTVSLTGTGVAPEPNATVTPASYDFGTVAFGRTATTNVTVTNDGAGPLSYDGVTLTGADAYAVTAGNDSTTIAAGGTHEFTVAFTPAIADTVSATLHVHTNDPQTPAVGVPVSGSGVDASAPNVAVSPATHAFGNVPVGGSATVAVTVTNDGTAPLTVAGATTAGSSPFHVTAGGGATTIAPGGRHTVTVAFQPLEPGAATGTLTVASNDTDTPQATVSLAGTGVTAPIPDIALQPTAHAFGDVALGNTTNATFTVANTGTAPLNVTNARLVGADADQFALTTPTPVVVAPGGTATLDLAFTPTTPGNASVALEVASNDSDEPTVTVTGIAGTGVDGTPPTVTITNVTGSWENGTLVAANDTLTVTGTASDQHGTVTTVVVGVAATFTTYVHSANATYDAATGNWTATVDLAQVVDDGDYRVAAAAIDDSGNAATVTAPETVAVDRTPPGLAVRFERTTSTDARVTVTSDEALRAGTLNVTVTHPDGTTTAVPLSATAANWTGTITLTGDGQYAAAATGVDRAGNRGTSSATTVLDTVSTNENNTVTVKVEPSNLFVRFTTDEAVNDTFVTMTASDTPLAPLVRGNAGVHFLNAVLGHDLTANLSYAVIGVPVDEAALPPGTTVDDVTIRYFNDTTRTWTDVPTAVDTVTLADGTTGRYWLANVTHFSTYGAVAADTTPPTVTGTTPADGHEFPAGTTSPTARIEYTDALSGVNASAVTVTFDGTDVTGDPRTSITSAGVTYRATGLANDTSHTLGVTVTDYAGNPRTESLAFDVAAGQPADPDKPDDPDPPTEPDEPADPDPPADAEEPSKPGVPDDAGDAGDHGDVTSPPAVDLTSRADGAVAALVTDARANESVAVAFGADAPAANGVALDALNVTAATAGDVAFTVRATAARPGAAPALDADAGTPLVYLNVSHPSVPNDRVAGATFHVTVDRQVLADAGVDPGDLAVYRYADGAWRAIDTRVVDATADRVVLEATSPGLSVFAVTAATPVTTTTTTTTTTQVPTTTTQSTTAAPTTTQSTTAPAQTTTPGGDGGVDTTLVVLAVLALLALAALAAALRRRA